MNDAQSGIAPRIRVPCSLPLSSAKPGAVKMLIQHVEPEWTRLVVLSHVNHYLVDELDKLPAN